MISLRRSIQADEAKHDWESAVTSYIAALEAVRDYGFRACPPLMEEYTQTLVKLAASISAQSTGGELTESGAKLTATLKSFGEQAGKDYESRMNEIREVVKLIALGTETFVARSRRGNEEITAGAKAVEEIATLQDLPEMRRRLASQVTQMRDTARRLAQEDAETIRKLSTETEALRERLHRAEESACHDELTSLANRRGLERQLDVRLRRQSRFCILLFDIRNFKTINDTYGHLAGDAVLREFGTRLKNCIRDSDVACRWGGDEFLAVLDCALHEVLPRSRQIFERITGRYVVTVDGQQLRIPVLASMGVAEHRHGEPKDQLLHRADSMLYESRKLKEAEPSGQAG